MTVSNVTIEARTRREIAQFHIDFRSPTMCNYADSLQMDY